MSIDIGITKTHLQDYVKDVQIPAFKFTRGGQPVFTICPTIEMVLDLLPKPDPTKKFPNNRLLNVAHAASWGKYWEENPESWGCPAGLVSTPIPLDDRFDEQARVNGMAIGVLRLPHDFAQISEILDMQHRIYGWHDKRRDISERILAATKNLALAEKNGPPELVGEYTKRLDALNVTKSRFAAECITVEICELSEAQHRTLFANIASKALPINKTQIADFDEGQTINRIARRVESHRLLENRVDWDKTRPTDTKKNPSPAIISGANLIDIILPFVLNKLNGRVPVGRNEQIAKAEKQIASHVMDFFTALTEAFPEFALDESDGAMVMTPADVRATSLLGSSSVLRPLAWTYYRLTRTTDEKNQPVDQRMTHQEVVDYFKELAPHMSIPLPVGSAWVETGVFADPAEGVVKAPSARAQDLRSLGEQLTDWAMGVRLDGPLAH